MGVLAHFLSDVAAGIVHYHSVVVFILTSYCIVLECRFIAFRSCTSPQTFRRLLRGFRPRSESCVVCLTWLFDGSSSLFVSLVKAEEFSLIFLLLKYPAVPCPAVPIRNFFISVLLVLSLGECVGVRVLGVWKERRDGVGRELLRGHPRCVRLPHHTKENASEADRFVSCHTDDVCVNCAAKVKVVSGRTYRCCRIACKLDENGAVVSFHR